MREPWSQGLGEISGYIRQNPNGFEPVELELLERFLSNVQQQDNRLVILSLARKLRALVDSLPRGKQTQVSELLSVVGGNLLEAQETGTQIPDVVAFKLIVDYFFRSHNRPDLRYHGRPVFMTDALLEKLQVEARANRSSAIERNSAHVAPVGEVCSELVAGPDVGRFLRELGLEVRSSGLGTFVYYEREGDGVRPHVDISQFEWNMIICIYHHYRDRPSVLRFYDGDSVSDTVLNEGDVLVFDAGRTFHSRPGLSDDARVTILSLGFEELGPP